MEIRQFFRYYIFIPSIVIGIILHEAIHGISWAIASKVHLSNIKFGFQLKTLTPYAHSKLPMKMTPYRIGAAMPLIIMGILPYIYALFTKNSTVLGFSIFFCFVAIGDIMILYFTRKISANKLVQDHPTKGGVIILD